MKKKLAILLSATLLAFTLVGCSKNGSKTESTNESKVVSTTESINESGEVESTEPQENYIIAVAWNTIDASAQTRMNYLENHLGPAIGVDFIFSESISDTDKLMTFLENAYASGADGFLCNITDGVEQVVARADELGIYTAFVSSSYIEDIAHIPTYMGITGIDVSRVAEAYGELLNIHFNSKEPANFIVISGGSAMGVRSHREATISMLNTLKEKYELSYDMDVTDLASISATKDIYTGNDNIKITIVPGFPNMDGYVSGVSSLLQTGVYDAVISVFPTTEIFATAIDEVEKALGKNIKMLCQANFGENTKLAFETLDSTGNPTLDGAVLYAGTVSDAYGVTLIYNGITGYSDVVKPNGKAAILSPGPLVCGSAIEYQVLAQLDTSDDMYVYVADEVKEMLKAFNDKVTYEDIMKVADEFNTFTILERRTLND